VLPDRRQRRHHRLGEGFSSRLNVATSFDYLTTTTEPPFF